MKKSLFFVAAVSALMLTACSSENDVVQNAPQTQETVAKAVGFDVYTQDANEVTRAGYEGVMTTTRLQGDANGFGVFGYYSDQSTAVANPYPTSGYVPNFMYNEQITWNNTNKGWQYSPLKYWPNETKNDSQTNPTSAVMDGTNNLLDQLTFFAYAPYVTAGSGTAGITAITANTGALTTTGTVDATRALADPAIEYITAPSCKNGVDLLWGVAPTGGMHYTAVNGETNGANEGLPYTNLAKPDVNTSLKFNFQHALARFGFTVAAAIDQVPQGGEWPGDNATRITIKQVELTGYFSNEGILNLNNPVSNVANWINLAGQDLDAATALSSTPGEALAKRTITISTDIVDAIEDSGSGSQSAKTGVTTAKQELLDPVRYNLVNDPTTFVAGDKYYNADGSAELYANITGGTFYYKSGNDYMKATNSKEYPTDYFTLTPSSQVTAIATLGMTNDGDPTNADLYKKVGDNYIFAYASGSTEVTASYLSANECYTLTPAPASVTASNFSWPDVDYYKPERSYLMVIPTNNVPYICTTGVTSAADLEALRTVWVKITYYVTTDDAKLGDGYSRVQNVVEKKVVLPSLDNGKSYNFNLLLGLTSVKVEAEVSDWKEIYVQTDLPQNTPGE